jgi:hypothetical protein
MGAFEMWAYTRLGTFNRTSVELKQGLGDSNASTRRRF